MTGGNVPPIPVTPSDSGGGTRSLASTYDEYVHNQKKLEKRLLRERIIMDDEEVMFIIKMLMKWL